MKLNRDIAIIKMFESKGRHQYLSLDLEKCELDFIGVSQENIATLLVILSNDMKYYLQYEKITDDMLWDMISDNNINFTGKYIENFDVTNYNLTEKFEFKSINANYSFWYCYPNFSGTVFNSSTANFNFSIFLKSKFSFYDTTFKSTTLSFQKSLFYKIELDFDHATFINSPLRFNKSIFAYSTITLNNTKFGNGEISFYRTYSLKGSIKFSLNTYGIGEINFDKSTINTLTFIGNKFISDVNLKFDSINNLFFFNCTNKEHMQIDGIKKQISFMNSTNLGRIDIDWTKCNLQNTIYNSYFYGIDSKSHNAHESYYTYTDISELSERKKLEHISYSYLLLKENYNNVGKYEWEDAAYREYMKYNTKALEWSRNTFIKKIFNWTFGKISGYGTKPFNIVLTSILTIIGFGIIYSVIFMSKSGVIQEYFYNAITNIKVIVNSLLHYAPHNLTDIIVPWQEIANQIHKSLYLSAITFLTIGYGDVAPLNGLMRFLAGIEGFLGLFFMSILTVTFMRKILR